jgi:hypothetical protein
VRSDIVPASVADRVSSRLESQTLDEVPDPDGHDRVAGYPTARLDADGLQLGLVRYEEAQLVPPRLLVIVPREPELQSDEGENDRQPSNPCTTSSKSDFQPS